MYQQITLIGNLGRDPKMILTAKGIPVTSFSVAANRSWTSQDGQRQYKTTWFRVSAWQRLAEPCNQSLSKGQRVLVVGEVEEPSTWVDREGNTRASLEVRARYVQFFTKQPDSEEHRLVRNRESSHNRTSAPDQIDGKTSEVDEIQYSELGLPNYDYSESSNRWHDEIDWENDIDDLAPEGTEWRDDDGTVQFPQ